MQTFPVLLLERVTAAPSSHRELMQNLAPVKLPGATLAHVLSAEKEQSIIKRSTSLSGCSTAKPERKCASHFQMPNSLLSFSMKPEK